MNNLSYPEEDTAVNDGDQVCYVGHLVCVCVAHCVCVIPLKAAALFMPVFSLRDRLKRQEIKLMEANQSRGRRFRLKLLHLTRVSKFASVCKCMCTCICVVRLLASAALSITSVILQSSLPAAYYIQCIPAQLGPI